MAAPDWFLSASERRNPATRLDRRHADGQAWSTGNAATPLVHGVTYFAELVRCLAELRRGDLVMFTDWRGDPDELLAGPGTEVSRVLCQAASRGVAGAMSGGAPRRRRAGAGLALAPGQARPQRHGE